PEPAEEVEVTGAVVVVEVGALGARPGPVEADRPQHASELRVDRARPELEALAAALRHELPDHDLTVENAATGPPPGRSRAPADPGRTIGGRWSPSGVRGRSGRGSTRRTSSGSSAASSPRPRAA